MAASMTNIEIEAELRKVLKINLNNELPPQNQNESFAKDNIGLLSENDSKIKCSSLISGEANCSLSLHATGNGGNNSTDNQSVRKDGMLRVSEIESRLDGAVDRINEDKAKQNLPKKKKKNRKLKLSDEQRHLGKQKSEAVLVSVKQEEAELLDIHNTPSNNNAFNNIISEKTIQNLPNVSVTAQESPNLHSSPKKKIIRKNKPSVVELQQKIQKSESVEKNDVKLIDTTLSEKVERIMQTIFDKQAKTKEAVTSMLIDGKSSAIEYRDPDEVVKTLERINLLMMDKLPPNEVPREISFMLEQQHIFPVKKMSSKQPKAKFFCRICDYHCNSLIMCRRHIDSSKHHTSIKEEMLVSTLRQLPIACDDQLAVIEDLLELIYKFRSIKDEYVKQRYEIVEKLSELCRDKIPANCEISLYGSSVSHLGLTGCDANINLSVPSSSGSHPGLILKAVNSILCENMDEFEDVKSDYEAKLPSVYFKHKSSGTNCVIGINNTAALNTSQLLGAYASLDKRVKILCVALRYWAKICQIDRQADGTLPPHAYDIMVIYFLQRQTPPVVPALCDVENPQVNQKEIMKNWVVKNWMPVAHLWVELFRFYSLSFPASSNVVSIRKLAPIPTAKKNWRNRVFSIEDPFMISRNLTRNVSSQNMNEFILTCFQLTFKYFGIPQLKDGPLFDEIKESSHAPSLSTSTEEEFRQLSAIRDEVSKSVDDPLKSKPEGELISTNDVSEQENEEIVDDDNSENDDETSDTDVEANDLVKKDDNDEEVTETSVNSVSVKHEDRTSVNKIQTSTTNEHSSSKQGESKMKFHSDKSLPTPSHILNLIKCMKKEDYFYGFKVEAFTGGKRPAIECSLCHKQGHVRKDCPEETLPPLRELPPMTPGFLEAISIACNEIFNLCTPTSLEWKARENLLNELQAYIRNFYSDAVVELFGSSCNGFGFKNSDLDLCLTFEGNTTGEGINCVDVIMNLAEKLKQMKDFSMVIAIPTAKVPIVKFMQKKNGLDCDISLYNTLAKCNTRMLLMYSKIDPRVTRLGYAMKYFAKLCDIGDASRGSLSSYAYTLMVLYFLQQRSPPVIPVLQELCEEGCQPGKHLIDGWNAWYFASLNELGKVWPYQGGNTETVGELWLGLLKFYTEEFNFKENVICIRQHKILTRFDKLWNSKCIAIEDPFDLNHNLGSGVSNKMSVYIRKTFIKGREVFGNLTNSLPNNYRSIREYLFDPRRLVEGPPPNDRGCRVCGKIGHMVRECPRKKGNMRQNRRGNNKNAGEHNAISDANLKGIPLIANRAALNNHQATQQIANPLQVINVRAMEPIRSAPPNFGSINNIMRPPMAWNVPRPFIQPNLNQRGPMPYLRTNSMMNRLPGPFPVSRPTIAQASNIRMGPPINMRQGNVFLENRHISKTDKSNFKPIN